MKMKFLLILLICVGCQKKDFYGYYVANESTKGNDTLIINKNYTYKHIFNSKSKELSINEGSWEPSDEGKNYIELSNFEWQISGIGIPRIDSLTMSVWLVEIEFDIKGCPYLTIDYDRGLKYQYIAEIKH